LRDTHKSSQGEHFSRWCQCDPKIRIPSIW
jgi:hypothetical protein